MTDRRRPVAPGSTRVVEGPTASPDGGPATDPVSTRRRWLAAASATVIVTVSFWSLAYGLVTSVTGTPAEPGGDASSVAAAGAALALLVMPAAFAAAAVVSRRPDSPLAVFYAMGLCLSVGLPLLVLGNPLAALVTGYAAGAAVALSRPDGVSWPPRAVAVLVVAIVALGGMATVFVVVALAAPALPFTAPLVADAVAARRATGPGGPVREGDRTGRPPLGEIIGGATNLLDQETTDRDPGIPS